LWETREKDASPVLIWRKRNGEKSAQSYLVLKGDENTIEAFVHGVYLVIDTETGKKKSADLFGHKRPEGQTAELSWYG